MAAALNGGDLVEAGRLMQASRRSMRDDFEISSDALDAMVSVAGQSSACFGARMTGGGFGGSCVALVTVDQIDSFERDTLARYHSATGLSGDAIRTRPTAGTSVEPIGNVL